MQRKPAAKVPAINRFKIRFWLVVLPALGVAGLFLTAVQLFPHQAAEYWRRQLADAPPSKWKTSSIGLPTRTPRAFPCW